MGYLIHNLLNNKMYGNYQFDVGWMTEAEYHEARQDALDTIAAADVGFATDKEHVRILNEFLTEQVWQAILPVLKRPFERISQIHKDQVESFKGRRRKAKPGEEKQIVAWVLDAIQKILPFEALTILTAEDCFFNSTMYMRGLTDPAILVCSVYSLFFESSAHTIAGWIDDVNSRNVAHLRGMSDFFS